MKPGDLVRLQFALHANEYMAEKQRSDLHKLGVVLESYENAVKVMLPGDETFSIRVFLKQELEILNLNN